VPRPGAPPTAPFTTLPFRRLAVVLSGGGALAAYEVGVLRVLEAAGLRPAILSGTSAGAVNALVWLVHDFDVDALDRTWRHLRSASVGMRWTTLGLRTGGAALAAYGLIQLLLTLLGSPEFAMAPHIWPVAWRREALSAALDALAWVGVAGVGVLAIGLSRPMESWLAALSRPAGPGRATRWLGGALLVMALVHVTMWGLGLPWPHRFSATVLAAGGAIWLLGRPGRPRDIARALLGRLLPESRGRGLWGAAARRRLIEDLVARGDLGRLATGETLLIINALALDSGRITHFVSGSPAGPEFERRVAEGLGEVVWLTDPRQAVEAAVASTAIPLAFEPVRIMGREFVDCGQFSNQSLEAVLAAGADALLVVLVAPSGGPSPTGHGATLVDLGARLLEVSNWRQIHAELNVLPAGWSTPAGGGPSPLCVVEPQTPLPGGLLGFDSRLAAELVERGAHDAWRALARAGWVKAGAAPPG
jgi:predicted acylesterase/phospholipase RssA